MPLGESFLASHALAREIAVIRLDQQGAPGEMADFIGRAFEATQTTEFTTALRVTVDRYNQPEQPDQDGQHATRTPPAGEARAMELLDAEARGIGAWLRDLLERVPRKLKQGLSMFKTLIDSIKDLLGDLLPDWAVAALTVLGEAVDLAAA